MNELNGIYTVGNTSFILANFDNAYKHPPISLSRETSGTQNFTLDPTCFPSMLIFCMELQPVNQPTISKVSSRKRDHIDDVLSNGGVCIFSLHFSVGHR